MLKNIITLTRPKHWVKNLFVFIPLLVSGSFFNLFLIGESFLAFIIFCLTSSTVYVFNDIIDKEKDQNHPQKKNRPIANGRVSLSYAIILIIFLILIIIFIAKLMANNIIPVIFIYLANNFFYSLVLKKLPIVDIICISLGFVLRVQSGVLATDLETSIWLIFMTFTLAMLLALGKRKTELNKTLKKETRDSLNGYSISSINNMQNIFVSCTLIFYLLYTNLNNTYTGNKILLLTSSLFVIMGLLRYIHISSLDLIEEEPTEILFKDKIIMSSVILWGLIIIISFFKI